MIGWQKIRRRERAHLRQSVDVGKIGVYELSYAYNWVEGVRYGNLGN